MKLFKKISFLCLFFCIVTTTIRALNISTIADFNEIISYLNNLNPTTNDNILAVFDIDDTLLNKQCNLVHPEIPNCLSLMTTKGIKTIALTYRGQSDKYYSSTELLVLNINLAESFDIEEHSINVLVDDNYVQALFYHGIIFVDFIKEIGFKTKGPVLIEFLYNVLEKKSYIPTQIIFIDDRQQNCESVAQSLEYLQIDYKCIHYNPWQSTDSLS